MVDFTIKPDPEGIEKIQAMLDVLQEEQLLTDYHGTYPETVVIAIKWVEQEDQEARPVWTAIAVRMPTHP